MSFNVCVRQSQDIPPEHVRRELFQLGETQGRSLSASVFGDMPKEMPVRDSARRKYSWTCASVGAGNSRRSWNLRRRRGAGAPDDWWP